MAMLKLQNIFHWKITTHSVNNIYGIHIQCQLCYCTFTNCSKVTYHVATYLCLLVNSFMVNPFSLQIMLTIYFHVYNLRPNLRIKSSFASSFISVICESGLFLEQTSETCKSTIEYNESNNNNNNNKASVPLESQRLHTLK